MSKATPMTQDATDEPGLACTLLGRALAERKEAISRELFAHADRAEELPDGFGYRFPAAEPWAAKALDFIAVEKQCCPFFTFELVFEPNDGPIWLRLRGSEAVKAFMRSELDGVAPDAGAEAAVTMAMGRAETPERNKEVIRRLVDEVLSAGDMDVIDELYAPSFAPAAREWITPFRASFPDVRMEVVDLIAEGDTVVGRFTCSATHTGEWLGHPPTGNRFEAVDEVSIFQFEDGRIVSAWGIEDNLGRLEQLGLR